ncbi:shikimate dehydrogenase [Bosea sp. OK403]|jgi:shikimate dehydrogenase|nr:shikimate dehydrogenase [Bosea sp. OK403]
MIPIHVQSRDLSTVLDGIRNWKNLAGFIVTVPHKTSIIPLLDEVTEAARIVGAVNAVRRDDGGRLIGHILDGAGFVAGLRQEGISIEGRSVYLAGAGGAASAIAFALAQAGVARLTIANRTLERCSDLVARLRQVHHDVRSEVGSIDPAGHDIVVNATSMGLKENDPFPLDVARLMPNQIVAEIIMQPEVTPLLAAAAKAGCRTHPGWPMLQCQLKLMADWMGANPERVDDSAVPASRKRENI